MRTVRAKVDCGAPMISSISAARPRACRARFPRQDRVQLCERSIRSIPAIAVAIAHLRAAKPLLPQRHHRPVAIGSKRQSDQRLLIVVMSSPCEHELCGPHHLTILTGYLDVPAISHAHLNAIAAADMRLDERHPAARAAGRQPFAPLLAKPRIEDAFRRRVKAP